MISPWRQDAKKWLGLALLVLGLALMDRSFALWRNDLHTLPNADGQYATDPIASPHSLFGRPAVREGMAIAGLAMLLSSVALVGNKGRTDDHGDARRS